MTLEEKYKDFDYKDFYEKDERFKRYVDRYCNEFNLTVDEGLTHALVQETAIYYVEVDKDKIIEDEDPKEEKLVAGCGGTAIGEG